MLVQGSPSCGHCFVPLSKTLYPLLSTGSTQEDSKFYQLVDWDTKNQNNQSIIVSSGLDSDQDQHSIGPDQSKVSSRGQKSQLARREPSLNIGPDREIL